MRGSAGKKNLQLFGWSQATFCMAVAAAGEVKVANCPTAN